MTAERNIGEVVTAVLEVIPPNYETARAELHDLMGSIRYSPPEMIRMRWGQFMEILEDNLPDPTADDAPAWAKQVAMIMSGEAQ